MAKRYPKVKPTFNEIATLEKHPYEYSFYRTGKDLVVRPFDEFLIEKGGLSAIKIYTRLLEDSTVQGAFKKLHQEIVSRDLIVTPFSEKKGDQVIADFVKNALENIDFDGITGSFLEAVIIGSRIGEIIWGKKGEQIIPLDIRFRDPRRFVYVVNEDSPGGYEMRMLTRENMSNGETLPTRKFLTFKYWISNDGDPYGAGLGRVLYPLVKFKRRALESEVIFSDRYSTPTAIATAPLNALASEIDILYDHLSNLSQETALIIPEGYSIDFLSASSSKTNIFMDIIDYCDNAINLLISGENEVGNVGAGSRASSEVANEVRVIMAKETSEMIHEFLRRSLIRWIVDFNFGTEYQAPFVRRDFSPPNESELSVNDVVMIVEKLGYKPPKSWLEDHFRITLEEIPQEEQPQEESKPGMFGL